ncbi:cytosine permease [Streptomyces sp. VRA16 Mangrove soil]|uniref:purine-cytosine permease family protein n=1 Tax=Streptomyces sp. VRA16 Mangrove soil TaxID=2817434 RepID=UPI001A9E7E8F|nr:cytosine permease [Streptomyces sp. VRA16 Mangrove soil]MBO1330820.1 cytosine permease [Streptomyces sp. VRA16 Mangrove soil]
MASTLPDPIPDTANAPAAAAASATRIEAHGIDVIPDADRRGRPRELFAVWAATGVNYLNLVVGGSLILMGLSLWQATAVLVIGSLFSVFTGLLAIPGPAAGAPSEVVTRALFGVIGNRFNNAVTGWLISVCYFALNLSAAAVAAFALVEKAGVTASTPVKVVVIVVIAALTLTISVYGHALIVKLYGPITLVLAAVFAVVAVVVVRHADFGYTPRDPLTGVDFWAVALAGVTMIASGPLSYTTSADFSRYLPRTTPNRAVIGWTALGGFVSGLLTCLIGIVAATAVDMTDPQAALEALLPGWFGPVFLLSLVLSTIALNALTAYSAGLALQAVGLTIRRQVSVLFDGTVAVALTLYGLLISNFLDTVNNVLQLTVVLLGPSVAVYATDIVLRRNRYDGVALSDETPNSPFWYRGGVNWAGACSLAAGVGSAALCVNTLYTGPIAAALDGVDLALPVGMVVAWLCYLVTMRRPLRGAAR